MTSKNKIKSLKKQIEGYHVASMLIDKLTNEAMAKCPKRTLKINRKSKEFRFGFFSAIMAAYCWMGLGEFPEYNQDEIKKSLGK